MVQVTPFMQWLDARVRDVGWSELLRRAKGAFTAGALQGWLRGAIPGPGNQLALAEVCEVPPQLVKDLVYEAWSLQDGVVPARPLAGGRRRASLSPAPARRVRKKLAALVFGVLALGRGSAGAAPLPVDPAWTAIPLIGHWRRRISGSLAPILDAGRSRVPLPA